MARLYRTHMVATDERESVGALSDAAYRVYQTLSLHADDEGRSRSSAKQVRAWTWGLQETARKTEEAESALAELERAGEIRRYTDENGEHYAALLFWHEDQRIDRPTPSRLPAPPTTPREGSRALARPREDARDVESSPASRAPADAIRADRDVDVEGDVDVEREGEGNPPVIPPEGGTAAQRSGNDGAGQLNLDGKPEPEKKPKTRKGRKADREATPAERALCLSVLAVWTAAGNAGMRANPDDALCIAFAAADAAKPPVEKPGYWHAVCANAKALHDAQKVAGRQVWPAFADLVQRDRQTNRPLHRRLFEGEIRGPVAAPANGNGNGRPAEPVVLHPPVVSSAPEKPRTPPPPEIDALLERLSRRSASA